MDLFHIYDPVRICVIKFLADNRALPNLLTRYTKLQFQIGKKND